MATVTGQMAFEGAPGLARFGSHPLPAAAGAVGGADLEPVAGRPHGGVRSMQAVPPSYLWAALLCLVLFLPGGLVALACADQVTRRTRLGDRRAAVRYSRLARAWCLLSVVAFAVLAGLTAGGILTLGGGA